MKNERALPEIEIEGTSFLVDVKTNNLIEKDNPQNKLYLFDMDVNEQGYSFWYDKNERSFGPTAAPSDTNVFVTVAPLVELDPEGMATKFGYTVEQIQGKTDYEVIVDQDALALRSTGKLPTIDIAGHLFYVDYQMEMLRPEDDFGSNGITFEDLDEFYSEETNSCIVPYDPKSHETAAIDYWSITTFPKDVIAVSIPTARQMDPVAYSRETGFDLKECLMEYGIRSEFKAEQIPWEKTGLVEDIKRNQAAKQVEKKQTGKKKGRGI